MGVLRFDGVDDRLEWTSLASALANASDGAWTVAVLVKRASTAAYHALSYLSTNSGNNREAGAGFVGVSPDPLDSISLEIDGETTRYTTSTFTSTASPYLIVISKGSGTVTPRIGWKLGSAGSWTHENFSGTLANQIAATRLGIGIGGAGSDFLNGWVGIVAWWEGAMSDANKEALDNNWRTSDSYNSVHGIPVFLAELNVAGTSVVDLIGNATSLSATGTSLDSGETLDSWNFDGIGSSAKTFSGTDSMNNAADSLAGRRALNWTGSDNLNA
jgi:hypothetical protein